MLTSSLTTEPSLQDFNLSPGFGESMTEIGYQLLSRLPTTSVNLIKLENINTVEDLRSKFPLGPIVACDFYLKGAENQELSSSGFKFNSADILNLDHHAPHATMYRFVSSGNLAIDYVRKNGPVPKEVHVVINHTDCDSILSSLVISGLLPPEDVFGDAVIAADHLGLRNPISDLLQALDSRRDINFSARNLGLLLTGRSLEVSAQRLLSSRMQGREETTEAIRSQLDSFSGKKLAVVELNEKMRNEFLPALLPEAVVILTHEKTKDPNIKNVRLRLGNAAPDGFTLFNLPLQELDPVMGGRWNAGSNKRGGGTTLPIEQYIERFDEALSAALL